MVAFTLTVRVFICAPIFSCKGTHLHLITSFNWLRGGMALILQKLFQQSWKLTIFLSANHLWEFCLLCSSQKCRAHLSYPSFRVKEVVWYLSTFPEWVMLSVCTTVYDILIWSCYWSWSTLRLIGRFASKLKFWLGATYKVFNGRGGQVVNINRRSKNTIAHPRGAKGAKAEEWAIVVSFLVFLHRLNDIRL